LHDTLKPFVDNIDKFKERMEELGKTQTQESSTLRGSIEQLQTLNQHMAEATGDLTRALKGNAKVRGDWGEMILDGVLTTCGFIEGINYQRQESNKDEETGKQLRPDVIFDLPDGRRVVIDSKVNLIAWADAAAAESVGERQTALTRHAAALRTHVKDLHGKNYPKVVGGQSLLEPHVACFCRLPQCKMPATCPPSPQQLTSFASGTDHGRQPNCPLAPTSCPFPASGVTVIGSGTCQAGRQH